jgi:hypothetical protein
MPARKIPLAWSSHKQKEPVVLKYDPTTARPIRICCIYRVSVPNPK